MKLYPVWVWGLSRVVKVRYERGVLKPLGSIDLKEGREYKVVVEEDIGKLIKKCQKCH